MRGDEARSGELKHSFLHVQASLNAFAQGIGVNLHSGGIQTLEQLKDW